MSPVSTCTLTIFISSSHVSLRYLTSLYYVYPLSPSLSLSLFSLTLSLSPPARHLGRWRGMPARAPRGAALGGAGGLLRRLGRRGGGREQVRRAAPGADPSARMARGRPAPASSGPFAAPAIAGTRSRARRPSTAAWCARTAAAGVGLHPEALGAAAAPARRPAVVAAAARPAGEARRRAQGLDCVGCDMTVDSMR
ncbi:hypothetical protein SETIT_8G165900v2 [Setaria italica]|uniref:Uncharacterized protein n=1 Tax=Setaria italica TaxID=4555 RepID=A0A368SA81_SETIT|nr:hypothetical protein SETIT_8G165900v2 [Setaria italica]